MLATLPIAVRAVPSTALASLANQLGRLGVIAAAVAHHQQLDTRLRVPRLFSLKLSFAANTPCSPSVSLLVHSKAWAAWQATAEVAANGTHDNLRKKIVATPLPRSSSTSPREVIYSTASDR